MVCFSFYSNSAWFFYRNIATDRPLFPLKKTDFQPVVQNTLKEGVRLFRKKTTLVTLARRRREINYLLNL
ncbi:MAG: hypothetical protein D6714_06325 [Bacteroidetes bacterium]|nr:MAG: hypothetical protein D6714_06325 [Bacteroidota bacterium]